MNTRNTTCDAFAISDLSSSARETVIEYIVDQMVGGTSPPVCREGSSFVLEMQMPVKLLDRVLPEWRVSASLECDGGDEGSTSPPSPSVNISLKRDYVHNIRWLRRVMHAFFFDTCRRVGITDTNHGVSTNRLLNNNIEEEERGNCGGKKNTFVLGSTPSSSHVRPFFSPLDIRALLFDFLLLKCAGSAHARQLGTDLLRAIRHHRTLDLGTMIFSALLSCPKYDELDVKLLLQWWAALHSCSHSGDADSRYILSGELWPMVTRCLSICSLSHEVKKATRNRIRNTILRWFSGGTNSSNAECSSEGATSVSLPVINGMPNFFTLPYSVALLQGYLGVSDPLNDVDPLVIQCTTTQMVPDAHVLALLLINTKVERLQRFSSPPKLLTLTEEIDHVVRIPIPEKPTSISPAFPERDNINRINNGRAVDRIAVHDEKDVPRGSSIDVAAVKLCQGGVSNNEEKHHDVGISTPCVSLLDHELRFKKGMESLEKRIANSMEPHQRVFGK